MYDRNSMARAVLGAPFEPPRLRIDEREIFVESIRPTNLSL